MENFLTAVIWTIIGTMVGLSLALALFPMILILYLVFAQ